MLLFLYLILLHSVVKNIKISWIEWLCLIFLRKRLHYLPEGEKFIEQILSQMNSNRLSTSGKALPTTEKNRDFLLSDIAKFLTKSSNYEYRQDGRV